MKFKYLMIPVNLKVSTFKFELKITYIIFRLNF